MPAPESTPQSRPRSAPAPFVLVPSAWACEESALETLLARFADPNALQAYLANRHERGERLGVRDGVAVLYAVGPMVKDGGPLASIFGLTTYSQLGRDLQVALDDKRVDSVCFYVDSPGGEVAGADELANEIYAARRRKPVHAYVSGLAASAGYWIASAAEKVTISEGALLGSIGVSVTMTDRSVADERRGVRRMEFVSSQSPAKATTPLRIQKVVDELANVFVQHVARQRGVSQAKVIADFGAGGMLVGKKAVAAGMADSIGSFETTLANLRRAKVPHMARPVSAAPVRPAPAVPQLAATPIAVSSAERAKLAAAAAANAAERERIRAIFSAPEARKRSDLASKLAFETEMTAEAAIEALRRQAVRESWKSAIDRQTP